MTSAILASENPEWCFFRTVTRRGAALDLGAVWEAAFAAVGAATGGDPEEVRAFLDSRHGRHFADDFASDLARGDDLATAIDAAVGRWMGWRIGRRTSRETGIPEGLPHLTGLVADCAIAAEFGRLTTAPRLRPAALRRTRGSGW